MDRSTHWSVLAVLVFLASYTAKSQTCISTGNGSWNNTASWNCDGINRLPTCGDTILVGVDDRITVSNQNNYEACGSPLSIDVAGELAFTNGNKLELPCGSLLSVQDGGVVFKSSPGGGTSTLISICETNIWTAGDGPLNGPTSFGGFVLPVELVSFKSEAIGVNDIRLTWQTASEVNNDFFSLYNADHEGQWHRLGEVKGAGNSNVSKEYFFDTKRELLQGNVFMLMQTDFDGTIETVGYTRLFEEITSAPQFIFWPNPSTGTVNVDVSNLSGEVRIILHSSEGITIQEWVVNSEMVTATVQLDVANLQRGYYILQVKDATKSLQGRILFK